MPRWAVPAAQHGNRLTLWLQRAAVFWRSELLLGAALVKNKKKLLRKVGGWAGGCMRAHLSKICGVVGVPARMHACMRGMCGVCGLQGVCGGCVQGSEDGV